MRYFVPALHWVPCTRSSGSRNSTPIKTIYRFGVLFLRFVVCLVGITYGENRSSNDIKEKVKVVVILTIDLRYTEFCEHCGFRVYLHF